MTENNKIKTILFLALTVLAVIFLAISLSQLDLQPGMPMPNMVNGKIVTAPVMGDKTTVVEMDEFLKIIIGLLLFGTFAYTAYKILKGMPWHELRAIIMRMALLVVVISGVIWLMLMILPRGKMVQLETLPQPTPTPEITAPLGPVPPIILWVVGIILLLICVAVGVWIYRATLKENSPIDLVRLEAQKARQALLSGADLKNVIIKCYHQMSQAVAQDKGIEREAFMTPREFERVLNQAGIPAEPLRQLTSLFESVRYGHWQPNPGDESAALECLEAIVAYCTQITQES